MLFGSDSSSHFQISKNVSESSEVLDGSFSAVHPKEILEMPSKCSRFPISSDLARLIILCRSESQIASELARFIVDLIASRKRAFAKLTVRDLFPESS